MNLNWLPDHKRAEIVRAVREGAIDAGDAVVANAAQRLLRANFMNTFHKASRNDVEVVTAAAEELCAE